MRKYKGIEVGRIVFSCLIPALHISFKNIPLIDIIQQYISRLGVPFFYAASGMFLIRSMEKYGHVEALKRYLKRVGRMLFIWAIIYAPFYFRFDIASIQSLLFKTPAYLWFLTGLLVAAIPFCLVKKRLALHWVAIGLYTVGTLLGDTYRWLVGGVQIYETIFLTTRNGIFFGLPFMCIGEITWKCKKGSVYMLGVSALLLIAEITYIGARVGNGNDRSMYLFLPLFVFYLVIALRDWKPRIETKYFGGISSAIYVMQFGIITMAEKAAKLLHIEGNQVRLGIWILTIFIPTFIYFLIKNTKLSKWLF